MKLTNNNYDVFEKKGVYFTTSSQILHMTQFSRFAHEMLSQTTILLKPTHFK